MAHSKRYTGLYGGDLKKIVVTRLSSQISKDFCEKVLSTLPDGYQGVLVERVEDLAPALKKAHFFMGFPVPVNILANNDKLEGIFLLSSQMPESYKRLNCPVETITGINARSVAEHALFLALKALKSKTPALLLRDLKIGVIGYGAIGKELSTLLGAMGGDVEILSRQSGFTSYEQGQEFLARNNLVFICVSLNTETKAFFRDPLFFSSLCEKVILVNIARGQLFEEYDLISFFGQNKEALYMTDVTYPEPYPDNGKLREHENISITPHVAGFYQGLWDEVFKKWVSSSWLK